MQCLLVGVVGALELESGGAEEGGWVDLVKVGLLGMTGGGQIGLVRSLSPFLILYPFFTRHLLPR